MARNGVQISQQGIDISRAADYQKVLDSNWKFLDIYDEIDVDVSFDITGSPVGLYKIPLATHSLAFVAGYEFFPSSKITSADGYLNSRNVKSSIMGDASSIYFEASLGIPSGRIIGKLRIFTVNLLEEYIAPTVYRFSNAAQPPGRYGAKFIDRNQGMGNIDSEDMEPFTLNTRGKQISIHKHGVAQGGGLAVDVTHNIGYPPSYMIAAVYTQPDGSKVAGPLETTFYLAQPITHNILRFRGVQSALPEELAYIILKDPMEVAG